VSGRGLEAVAAEAGGVRALFDAAERGDTAAQALLSGPLHLLADRVHDAHCLLGLDAVTLGGSVGLRNWTHAVLQDALPALPLHRAAHGPDAGLLGAALYAAQEQTT
jgi:predicted NBD/HSP70 family sugar kinase